MSNGIADKVAKKVKSIVIGLGKDRDDDHVDTYVHKVFDESLILFKKLSRRRLTIHGAGDQSNHHKQAEI